MNRRDQKMIARNLTDSSGRMVLNRVAILNFITKGVDVYAGAFLTEETRDFYFNLARKVVCGKLNAKLYQDDFAEGDIHENSVHEKLHECASSCMTDWGFLEDFLAAHIEDDEDNTRIAVVCSFTFSAPCKDDLGLMDGDSLDYNFIVCAVCKAVSSYGTYFIDENGQAQFVESQNFNILPKPVDGFVYPDFHNGFPDVNHMMIFTDKPSDRVLEHYADNFGLKFIMSCKAQKESFDCIIRDIFGEKLTYSVYVNILSALDSLRANYDPTESDCEITKQWTHEVCRRLLGADLDYSAVEGIWESYCCGMAIYASAVYANNIQLKSNGFTIKTDSDHASKFVVGKCTDGFKLSTYTDEEIGVGNTRIYG